MKFRGYECGPRPERSTKEKSCSPVDRQTYTSMIHDSKKQILSDGENGKSK